jgi:hypothetical protein
VERNFSIKIADLKINLNDIFSDKLRRWYCFFLSRSHFPEISLNLDYIPAKRNLPLRVKKKEGQVFQIERSDFFAEIDFASFQGELKVAKNIYSFDSFLRILYSLYLLYNDGFLLHSAGIKKDGKVYLFSGSSLSGKTTVIRHLGPTLTNENAILSDEIIAIRKEKHNGGNYFFFAYPTPFWGEFKSSENINNQRAKIDRIFFLGNRNFAKLSFNEAVERLLENTIFFSRDPSSVAKLFNLGIEFLQQIPSYQLKATEGVQSYLNFPK